ncbi:cytochrome P450 [Thozetella sp. PMI_491]|nr:cytochrome P450 [Thozetella sp. PMI_491]
MENTLTILGWGTAIFVAYSIAWCIYAVWFHPLAKWPGPFLAKVTLFWYAKHWTSGRWPHTMLELHRKYGSVIRIGPNELLFSSLSSLRDIYGAPRGGRKIFNKAKEFYDVSGDNPGIPSIYDPEQHAFVRKLLAPAFSAKSLRDQEHVIHRYVNLFIEQMERIGHSRDGVEMPEAFTWLTFDITGELAFGESFEAVENARSHFWVSLILDSVNVLVMVGLCKRLPVLYALLPLVLPKGSLANFKRHQLLTNAKTKKRIEMGNRNERSDFFSHILKGELSEKDLAANANALIVAGSETTATTFSACTALLLKNPECLSRLREEVRASFESTYEITGSAVAKLPYLNAVIEETLRYYPPTPFGFPRVSPGETIDGVFIPKGVIVSTDHWLAGRDPRNFEDPDAFRPERWIKSSSLGDISTSFAFSVGPYACLGVNMAYLELRVALAKMLFHFDWELVEPELELIENSEQYVLWKMPKFHVRYHRRNDGNRV